MADGFAQASGNAAFVNLHTASGVGNGMGALFTAWHNRTPLVMTAGQQTRQMLALEPWLVSREATELPRPYVKWSHEPARAEDVPAAIERAYHIAMAPPRGPVFVSIPMDDWNAPAARAPRGGSPACRGRTRTHSMKQRRWPRQKPYAGGRRRRRSRRRLGRSSAARRTGAGAGGKPRRRSASPSRKRTACFKARCRRA